MRAPEFWESDGAWPRLLAPLAAGVDLAGRLRRALARPTRLPVPVICVGNLVAGGAGKTPVVLDLLRRLNARGREAHCVTRGYGGRAAGPLRVVPDGHSAREVGDEALLLARAAPTWVARDRVAGARAACQAGADLLVLDDGFQNPAIVKDLSLVVVDGTYGFGNGRVIPAGPLRERIADGLARADALVLIGADETGVPDMPQGHDLPLLRARLKPTPDAPRLAGRTVIAFAGIGRPAKFFETLRDMGAVLIETHPFADHQRYQPAEIEALLASARARDAVVATTEKDAVRLPPEYRAQIQVVAVALQWDEAAAVDRLLDRLECAPSIRSAAHA